jgi:hypothetical protein
MFDTVILKIPISTSAIINHDRFSPSTESLDKEKAGFHKYINNPTSKDKEKMGYMPRLTIIKRGFELYLKVEFSAPKIIFANNLEELSKIYLNPVVNELKEKIEHMGVKLWTYQIKKAKVTNLHPSKNIILSKGYTACFSIRELSKINLHKKMDIRESHYRNNGEELQLYANRHSLVFYDKINDLTKPAKRATDKDQTRQQELLFDYIKSRRKDLEVLRMETRITHATKLKEILREIEFEKEHLTFEDLFEKDVCKKILQWYWDKFFEKDLFLFNVKNNPQNLLETILINFPKTRIKTAVMLVGLERLCKDEEGIRGLRSIAENHKSKTDWLKLRNYLRRLNEEIFTKPTHGFIKDIRRELDEFKPFRIREQNPICYVKKSKV